MAAAALSACSASKAGVRLRLGWARAALGLAALIFALPAFAQEASSHPNYLTQSRPADDVPIATVVVRVTAPSGDAARDAEALATVEDATAALSGTRFSTIEFAALIRRLEADPAIARVTYRLLPDGANAVRVAFDVAPSTAIAKAPEARPAFPVLFKNDRNLVTAIVAGGIGVYSDGNPWFGQPALFIGSSPVAGSLPGARATWTEGSLEVGAGFATGLGDGNFYAFGALTGMFTWTLGQDIFRGDSRSYLATEKAYAGLLYADPATHNRAKLSIGRQTYTLNDGFLVNMVKGSANVGPRGASYLGPRLANDFSVLAEATIGRISGSVFYIDPNELESLESDSHYLGGNLAYAPTEALSLDATILTVPASKTTFATPQGRRVPREGEVTVAGHVLARNVIVDGLFVEGELAHQFHDGEDVSAWAGYGTLGYIAREAGWSPSFSYRYAMFSGDNPDTVTFERFDAPLSTGLGIWLQGISFGKLFSNTNLVTHRVQVNVVPVETLNVTFEWHKLVADQLNNLGATPAIATLQSTDIGNEVTLTGRWAINRKLYLQGVISAAMPGRALTDIGADRTWSTVQLSLYWSL
jgi:hypothetical protein